MKYISKLSAIIQFYLATYLYQDGIPCGPENLGYHKKSPSWPFPSAPSPLHLLDKWNLLRNWCCIEIIENVKITQRPQTSLMPVITSHLQTPKVCQSFALLIEYLKTEIKSLISKIMNFGNFGNFRIIPGYDLTSWRL